MAYFDYLEAKNISAQKDLAFAESYNKISMWLTLASVILFIVNVIIFSCVRVGSIIWLDIVVAAGIAVGIAGMVYALKVRALAKRKRNKDYLANFLAVWSLFFVLLNVIIFIINTWVYFA